MPRLRRRFAAEAGFAGVGNKRLDRNEKPIEIIMARGARPISIGDGAYRDRTDDLRLAKPALSQLS
jgi:hypothetical protein